jgi:hypothetical protein
MELSNAQLKRSLKFGRILVSFLGPTYNFEQVRVALVGFDDSLS